MKRFLRNLPIKQKLMGLTVAISGVALLLACAAFAINEQNAFRRTMARDFAILANMFGDNVAAGLEFGDTASIKQTLRTLRANPHIVAACVYDRQGTVAGTFLRAGTDDSAYRFPPAQPTGQRWGADRLNTFQNVDLAGETVGVVYIATDLGELRERAWRYAVIVGLLLLGCSLVALLLAARLQRIISQPIEELAHTVATVAADKNYAVRASKQGDDELGRLIDGFNEMLTQIQARDAALGLAHANLEQRVEERTAELAQENALRQQVEAELRAKTALLEAQMDASIDGILVVDNAGRKLFQNQRMLDLWKIPPDIAGEQDDERQVRFVANQLKDPDRFVARVGYLYTHPTESSRDEIECRDGMVLDRYSAPVVGKDGKQYGRIWGFRDITERMQAEEALQRSETRFRSLIENTSDWIWEIDEHGRYRYASPRVLELLGYTPEEVLGKSPFDFMLPDEAARVGALLAPAFAAHTAIDALENTNLHRDGHPVVLETKAAPIFDQQGRWLGYSGIDRDITKRKLAEESLRMLGAAVEQATESIMILEAETDSTPPKIVFVNPAFTLMTGYTAAEAIGRTPAILHGPHTDAALIGELTSHAERGEPFACEVVNYRRDGTEFDVDLHIASIRDAGGKITHAVVIQHDITERKRSEAALRESRQILAGIINAIPVRVFWKDKNLVYLGCNAAFARDAGFVDPKDIIGKDDYQMGWSGQADLYRGDDRQVIESGSPKLFTEEPQTTPEGHTITLLSSKLPLRDARGEINGVLGVYMDITERKHAESALRLSEERFRIVAETANDVIYEWDLKDTLGWLGKIDEMLGYAPGEFPRTLSGWAAAVHPEDLEGVMAAIRAHLEKSTPYAAEFRVRRKDGTYRLWSARGAAARTPDGKPFRMIGSITDITERRQAETALRESNDKFQQLADNITDTFWIRSPDLSEVHYVSPAFERIWGRSVASLLANPHQWSSFILPADRERVQAAFDALTGDAPSLDIEYRIVRPDGEIRWVHVRGFQVRDAAAKLIRHIGIVTDITAHKRSEAELAKAHRELLAASRQAGMAEVATGVLHNVGNVLNSVNVSATLVAEQVRHSQAGQVGKLAALVAGHQADLAGFLTTDARGRIIPQYLDTLAESLVAEQQTMLKELDHLRKNIEHIKDIVSMQQAHGRASGVIETVALAGLVEEALRMNASSLLRHDVELVRDFQLRPTLSTDRHKVMQILINLLRNALQACDESGRPGKQITVQITGDARRVRIAVRDNGTGITGENLTRIFNHGFTTKKGGHGFGLHSGALAAREMGGALTVQSDGPGRGATFTLELPCKSETPAHENSVR